MYAVQTVFFETRHNPSEHGSTIGPGKSTDVLEQNQRWTFVSDASDGVLH
jgi:hypothetical protein